MNRSIFLRRCLIRVSLCAACCLVAGDSLSAGDVRKWTSKDGKTSFVGEMRGYSPEETEAVISKTEDGKTVRVPIKDLSDADQKYVRAFIERAQRGGGSSEPLVLDPTPPSVEREGDRWLLKPAISIGLPNGADEWKVTSKKPLIYSALPKTAKAKPIVTVMYQPFVSGRADRVQMIKAANEQTLKLFRERGVTEPTGNAFNPMEPGKVPQISEMRGETKQRNKVACRSVLRFDLEGFMLIRAFGDLNELANLTPVMDEFIYLSTQAKPATPKSTAPATNNSQPVTAKMRGEIEELIGKSKKLLMQKKLKEPLESVLDPVDYARMTEGRQLDEVIKGFDASKQKELTSVLDSLDWSNATYVEAEKKVAVRSKNSDRPIYFVMTDQGWRMRN